MEKATISQMKNRLSAYLKKVRAGESVLILDRDEPIAVLQRVDSGSHQDDRLARLERSGFLRRAAGPMAVDVLREPVPKPRQSVLDALVEDRHQDR